MISRRSARLTAVAVTSLAVAAAGQDKGEPDQGEPDQRLQRMATQARRVVVRESQGGGEFGDAAALVETPVFRYSDQRRGIRDGALWQLGGGGRPLALLKTETYGVQDGRRKWISCLASLSDGRIEARWKDGPVFRSTKPGLEMQPLPDAPRPSKKRVARLLQMKRLADRFTATIRGAAGDDRMRLLRRPLTRYDDRENGLLDGALFGWTMGTNPDALLAVELVRSESGPVWQFGWARMTSGGLTCRLGEEVVFQAPFDAADSGRPGPRDRWIWTREFLPE